MDRASDIEEPLHAGTRWTIYYERQLTSQYERELMTNDSKLWCQNTADYEWGFAWYDVIGMHYEMANSSAKVTLNAFVMTEGCCGQRRKVVQKQFYVPATEA